MKNILKLNKKPKKNSKAVVGGKKKLTRNKWKVAYLSLVFILLFSSIGYTGYGIVKARSIKAKATGWSVLFKYSGQPTVYGCKQSVDTIYGPFWNVHILSIRPSSWPNGMRVELVRDNAQFSGGVTSYSWLYGFMNGIDIYSWRLYPNMLFISTANKINYFVAGFPVNNLNNC